MCMLIFIFFFFNDTATTEIYTLSLHDALPISGKYRFIDGSDFSKSANAVTRGLTKTYPSASLRVNAASRSPGEDRKSTRLNSSHSQISYAVFCLKKKKKHT